MRRSPVVLALLLAAAPAWAADLKIDGPAKIDPYRLVKLKLTGQDAKAGLLWKVRAADTKSQSKIDLATKRTGPELAFVAPPGSYTAEVTVGVVGADGALQLDAAEFTVQIGDPEPPPNPDPPGPGPTPPAGSGAWVILVADDGATTPAQTAVIDGATARGLKAAGKCRVYGSVTDADKLSAKKYDQLMKDAGVSAPALIVLDKTGRKVMAAKLPADDAGLAAALKGVIQ